jgi:hypothetical protein
VKKESNNEEEEEEDETEEDEVGGGKSKLTKDRKAVRQEVVDLLLLVFVFGLRACLLCFFLAS